ncbi:MAG: leucine-rich repeat protein [Clostridia bacterium]|nr:leucine-rich repeat protein [Clostridia bacterium]
MKINTKKGLSRRLACIGLTAVMASTFAVGQAFALSGGKSSVNGGDSVHSLDYENVTGKVNLDKVKFGQLNNSVKTENNVNRDEVRTVIVRLSGEPLCNGDLEDRVAYEELKREQNDFLASLSAAGVSYELKNSYTNVVNAVAISVKLGDVAKIKGVKGVSAVTLSETYSRPKAVDSDSIAQINYSNIYASGIYDSSEYLDVVDGSGMTVAILDTGLDYTHEAFSPSDMAGKNPAAFTAENIEQKMENGAFSATKLSGATADDVFVNNKVPFAYDYADKDADVYPTYSQHGTHVAGIVAGKAGSYTDKNGHTATYIDGEGKERNIPFRGVAPEAQLVICKVFSDDLDNPEIGGAETPDILAALDDCVKLNVDVINMSLGTSCGFSSVSLGLGEEDSEGHLMHEAYENIKSQGISLMVAASNEFSAGYGSAYGTNLATNPDSGTIGSPSTFSGAMSVASINGQYSSYILANADIKDGVVDKNTGSPIYYEDSRNEDSDAYNFINDLLGCKVENCKDNFHIDKGLHDSESYKESATFGYVVIPGTGDAAHYTTTIRNQLRTKTINGVTYDKVIAVIRRGSSAFKDKIQVAMANGADAVIVYNNVSGMIRMSLGDLKDNRIPAVSVSMDAGLLLTTDKNGNRKSSGTISFDRTYQAGPFMNDYSSWGVTPDLQLKPEVTSHGGEITSTVAGGYDEMSGTSMACPNLAGFTALLRSYLKGKTELWDDAVSLTNLTNNIMMSTATTVYDQNTLPYSPRKQGAGLATLKNVFETKAYLYTVEADGMCEDGRPKAELGEDKNKKGVYTIKFHVKNFGDSPLTFKTKSIFMTETLGADGRSVAEKAYEFKDSTGVWKVNGQSVAEGGSFDVAANGDAAIEVTLTLTKADKDYLDKNFKNGMFVEGFLKLESESGEQCDLTLPFMGFYGDWAAAPMLDLDCFEIAKDDSDTSLKEEERRKPSVWATQAYGYYWNEKYTIPLGSFLYTQDEAKEHTNQYVYADEEHIAISRFSEYYGENDARNYLSVTGIKALYAGLLRNAEIVTYKLYNVDTGEIIPDENGNEERLIYRVGKSYAAGGSATPSQVLMELRTDELGLEANGKYRLDYEFYFKYDDYKEGRDATDKYSMSFYIDYEAPILTDSRLRFQTRTSESGKQSQTVYLDLDVYDNHYPQAVILCYSESDEADASTIKLATQYVTPIVNPKRNTTTTVSIDITEFYDDYKGRLFVEIDDYALNHNVYGISLNYSLSTNAPESFTFKEGSEITIKTNEAVKLTVENLGSSSVSNLSWRVGNENVAKVKNGEIFGASAGVTYVSATGANNGTQSIKVTVLEDEVALPNPTISFGTILNYEQNPVKATGIVRVNPAQEFELKIVPDPWYYPVDGLSFSWTSEDESLATVDENGNVSVKYEGDKTRSVLIRAACTTEGLTRLTTSVTLSIADPFRVDNGTLTAYHGWGGELNEDGVRVLTIPSNKSITVIGDEAFKENENVEIVIIPKAVTSIGENAFVDCKNLKKVCFVSEEKIEPADSSLNLIRRLAFNGCENLETLDLSNCKVINIDKWAFTGCSKLKEIIKMQAIGGAGDETFAYTALESIDITKLHVAGSSVFAGCTELSQVLTGTDTALGVNMFAGCNALETVEINCVALPVIPAYAFRGCANLKTVKLNSDIREIGRNAFENCSKLLSFDLNGHKVDKIGDYAFRNCVKMANPFATAEVMPVLGRDVFGHVSAVSGEVVKGGVLYAADKTVTSSALDSSVTEIGPYAYYGSSLSGVNTLDLSNVVKVGEGAFSGLANLTAITIPEGWTEIPAYAFRGTELTSIVIPASVTKIGANAFENCTNLKTVTFADDSQLTEIGASAFANTAIGELELQSVTKIGTQAFANCRSLTTAHISAVTEMGNSVFAYCTKLATVTFDDGAEVTGASAFLGDSALTTVELSDKIDYIGDGAFAYCTSLETITLAASEIGSEAFRNCTKLTTVNNINNVKVIGQLAFANCTGLKSLNLTSATAINYGAFFACRSLSQVTLGDNLQGIGDEAFAECALTDVNIPANCGYVGVSAFSGLSGLSAFTVDSKSKNYFAEDGVLYRYISGSPYRYELVAYPVGKTAPEGQYRVLDGTVTIAAFAFYGVPQNKINKVILPYTLKTIGNGAFYASGILSYQFESIVAPTLLEGVSDRVVPSTSGSANSFFYNNFGYIANSVPLAPDTPLSVPSPLAILYPANGTGYDNFIYTYYFSTRTQLEEMKEDDTRTLINILEELEDASVVASWASSTSTVTKEEVEEFRQKVITAHELYNGLKSDTQLEYVGETKVAKLFAVEEALGAVKEKFGIKVPVLRVTVAADSAHKSHYKVGESFSLKGLKITVTYEDYSTKTVNAAGNFALSSRFERPLRDADSGVLIEGLGEYEGQDLTIAVLVDEKGGSNASEGEGTQLSAGIIAVIVVGAVAAVAVAALAAVIVLYKKKVIVFKSRKVKEDKSETETADEAAATEETEQTEQKETEENGGEEGKTDD